MAVPAFRATGRMVAYTTSYEQVVLADGPNAYWQLDEPSGSTAADSGARANTGTINGGVTLGAEGPLADGTRAMTFNGTSGYIQVADNQSLDPGTSDFTLEAWIKTSSTSQQLLIDKYNGSAGDYYQFYVWTTGKIFLELAGLAVGSSTVVRDGSFHHVAVSATRAGLARFYLDGQADGTGDISSKSASNLNNAGALSLGRQRLAPPVYFNGTMGQIAIYFYAMTANQVLNHYNIGRARFGLDRGLPGAA